MAGTTSSELRYLQVERALRKDISDGTCPVGSRLETEHELAHRFSVSRYTVRAALRLLRDENLVSSRPRRGTLVLRRPDLDHGDGMDIDDLLTFAADTRLEIESIDMVTIDAELEGLTGLSAGGELLTVRGARQADDAEPLCWAEYYINSSFAAVGRLLQRHTGAILTLIEDLYGVTIIEAHEEITAILTPAELADGLKVPQGAPALRARRTYLTSAGEVAQVTVNTYAASHFRHSMTFRPRRSQVHHTTGAD